ncbi:MAG: radical SAM protein [Nanoarchaeota archaeon]|nr:radical SAM protein [Nanoarchaeota archaeon]
MGAYLTLLNNVVKSNFGSLAKPYKLTFVVSYSCNSRCKLCSIWKRKTIGELTLEEIKHLFSKNPYFNWIDVTGGEISTVPDIDAMFDAIITSSPNLYLLHFPTNGFMTKRIIGTVNHILGYNVPKTIVSISLDGPQELHDRLRGIKHGWRNAIDTYRHLAKLRSDRFDCYLGMTLSKYNISSIGQTLAEVKKEIPVFDERSLHINIAHSSEVYYENRDDYKDFSISAEDYKAYVIPFIRRRALSFSPVQMLEQKYQGKIIKYLESKKVPMTCRSLDVSCFIDSKGIVYPCGFFNHPVGSLREHDFDLIHILRSKKSMDLIQEIRKKKCPNCWTPCEAYQTILGGVFSKGFYT